MSYPKITVFMPVYNAEKYLREAIESILCQTYRDFEFLIINDASTDSSREIILSCTDPRIKLVDNNKNLGIPGTRNRGIEIASGDYIAFMDADDVSFPQRLEKQLQFLEKNQGAGVVASWVERIREDGSSIGPWRADRKNNTTEEIYYTLNFKNCIANSSALINRELILKEGGYRKDFHRAEDYELWLRLSRATRISKRKEVLVKWRESKSVAKDEVHKSYVEKLYIENFYELLSNGATEEILLFIKNFKGKNAPAKFSKILKIFNQINNKIINSADSTLLDIKKLKKIYKIRKSHFIFNLVKRNYLGL